MLDVLATDDKCVVYHIEIQLADSDDHILRVRFYSAMTDSELLEKGTKYTDLPNTHIFYISMNDFMNLKTPIAKVRSYIGDEDKVYDDGKSIYFVNAAVNDQSEVAKLMDYFKLADPYDLTHGELSDRVHLLKCDPEGEEPMCAITQSFVDEGKIIGYVECLRDEQKASDDTILEKIKEKFQLSDYQARTFVFPKEAVTV